jgi:hypothetical protein
MAASLAGFNLRPVRRSPRYNVIESVLGRRIFTRQAGDALHPEREPLQILAAIRQTMTEYNLAAQHQQSPIPLEGAMVKIAWLKYYEPSELPQRFIGIVQSWDTANKATELSDFGVCTTWGIGRAAWAVADLSLLFPRGASS